MYLIVSYVDFFDYLVTRVYGQTFLRTSYNFDVRCIHESIYIILDDIHQILVYLYTVFIFLYFFSLVRLVIMRDLQPVVIPLQRLVGVLPDPPTPPDWIMDKPKKSLSRFHPGSAGSPSSPWYFSKGRFHFPSFDPGPPLLRVSDTRELGGCGTTADRRGTATLGVGPSTTTRDEVPERRSGLGRVRSPTDCRFPFLTEFGDPW